MATSVAGSRKRETHARILAVAARTIRAHGVEGAGVDRVMGDAGLTRGGFYAHFADRHAMIAEALDLAFDSTKRNLFDLTEDGDAWLAHATRRYLSRAHRDAVAEGCPLPVLAGEMSRAPDVVRATFARQVEDVLTSIARRLGGGRVTGSSRRRAARVLASWVGALALARTVDDVLGATVLDAVREELGASAAPRRQKAGAAGAARAANGPSSKGTRAKSSDAVPESTRARSSSRRPARARARTSRSHA